MSAHAQIRVGRSVLELLQHSDAVRALMERLFPPPARTADQAPDIDWEDGEPHPEREPGRPAE